MLSNKPYLIRAFYEWIIDSECTPILVVNANYPNTFVPTEFIEDGEICLNTSPEAIRELKLGNSIIEFRASFSGVVHFISVPVAAVLAIYAHENEQGMFFEQEDEENERTVQEEFKVGKTLSDSKKIKSSHLKLVE